MIKANGLLKILIIGVCMVFYAVPSAFSDDGSGSAGKEPSESDYNYSNLYPKDKGLPILPQAMVMYCKFDAEKAVKDWSVLTECIKKYAKAMNNSDVATKTQAMKDYDTMRLQALNHTLAGAAAIVTSIPNIRNDMEKYNQMSKSTQSEFDAIQANTTALAFSNKIINDVRKIYAEYMQYLAIDSIGNIDPTAILSEEEAEESKNAGNGGDGTGSQ